MKTKIIASLLADCCQPAHRACVDYLARKTGLALQFLGNEDWEANTQRLMDGDLYGAFGCGALFAHDLLSDKRLQLVAAPVYADWPDRAQYRSEIVVRARDGASSLKDLRGRRWVYNEPRSHSGFHSLLQSLEEEDLPGFFGEVIESGSHAEAMRMVASDRADFAAVDAHVYRRVLAQEPSLDGALRSLQTSPFYGSPPLMLQKSTAQGEKEAIEAALVNMHTDPASTDVLSTGCILRFSRCTTEDYRDVVAATRLGTRFAGILASKS